MNLPQVEAYLAAGPVASLSLSWFYANSIDASRWQTRYEREQRARRYGRASRGTARPRARPITYRGKLYGSLSEAAKATGTHANTIRYRLKALQK